MGIADGQLCGACRIQLDSHNADLHINTAAKDNHVVPPKAKTKGEKLSALDPNLLSLKRESEKDIYVHA